MEQAAPGYLDYAATTPVDNRVTEAIAESLKIYTNPSSSYSSAWQAKKLINSCRQRLSSLLKVETNNLILTSGGTEGNNFSIKGRAFKLRNNPGHIICSAVEHASILATVNWCEEELGFSVSYIAPDANGVIHTKDILAAIRPDTQIVTVMAVNNELGTRQPIAEISEALANHPDIFFHVDAVQALGKVPLNLAELHVDSMTFSAHKIYGPKGVGALYLRNSEDVVPLVHGGGQESGRRGGTENLPGIAGFDKALELLVAEHEADKVRIRAQKQLFLDLMNKYFPQAQFNGTDNTEVSVDNLVSVRIPGFWNKELLEQLDLHYSVRVSRGSACTNNQVGKSSHVLDAIGLSPKSAGETLRISFGRFSREQDVRQLVKGLLEITNHSNVAA